MIEKLKNRYENHKINKKRRNEIESKWDSLIGEEEKMFYQTSHYFALEEAVNKILMNKSTSDVEQCLIEVEYLYRRSINKKEASSQINIPSILGMTSGAYLVYSMIFQLPLNKEYNIVNAENGFVLEVPDGNIASLIFLLIIIIALALFVVYQMAKASTKNNREVCYYENLLKILNKKQNSKVKECEVHNSNEIINSSVGFIVILHFIKKMLKRK